MCVVSDKIKFCTCSANDLEAALNTWTLFRKKPKKPYKELILGLTMMPLKLDKETDFKNKEVLHRRVNEKDAFDIDLAPMPGDRLLLSFSVGKDSPPLWYGFEFRKGSWKEKKYSVFGWMETHEEKKEGKIDNPGA